MKRTKLTDDMLGRCHREYLKTLNQESLASSYRTPAEIKTISRVAVLTGGDVFVQTSITSIGFVDIVTPTAIIMVREGVRAMHGYYDVVMCGSDPQFKNKQKQLYLINAVAEGIVVELFKDTELEVVLL